ncbi:Guanylyl cyclase [Gorgonomyces haynaldii]|nr:Guanylyl cyclase [Gorgonomyces haynaldii]
MLDSVPHIPQLTTTDCGLAAVSMILTALCKPGVSVPELMRVRQISSEWTIQLAYILAYFQVTDFTMYTSYIGVNWQHSTNKFYGSLSQDMKIVHSLFAKAQDHQVRVVPLIVSMENLKRFMSADQYACIVLVNLNDLVLVSCCISYGKSGYQFLTESEFVGHYIVLIGYDAEQDIFFYRDPGTNAQVCTITSQDLDRARSAQGTDHDLIIVKII